MYKADSSELSFRHNLSQENVFLHIKTSRGLHTHHMWQVPALKGENYDLQTTLQLFFSFRTNRFKSNREGWTPVL